MSCYHCAEKLPEPCLWDVTFDDQSCKLCCVGCQAVMQAIIDAGLSDYYRFRTEPAEFGIIPNDIAAYLDELAVFDEPEIHERYLTRANTTPQCKTLVDMKLAVQGLRCGACVWVLERSLSALPGVTSASVNYSTARATIRFDTSILKVSDILKRVAQMGYQSLPFDARQRELSLQQESRRFMQRLFLAGIATMQVMMYALPAYITGEGEIDFRYETLFRWASLILTTPVVLYSAQPFLLGAWRDLKRRSPGMDVPVCIGILTAYLASLRATLSGDGNIYFDSVSMFIFLLLSARYIEWSIRRRAMRAVDDISCAAPETAQRINSDGQLDVVPAARLVIGDLVAVAQGSRIPVDGTVHGGSSSINNALITGESLPVSVSHGDEVPGGALLTGSPIQLRVLRNQAGSTLSTIDQLIDRGSAEKPQSVQLADRLATLFVGALLAFASVVWLAWMYWDPARAGPIAIAVLVVSCPCALSLATPAALAAATGALLKKHVLITRGHALETLSRVNCVVFDKTGTLTNGQPIITGIQTESLTNKNQVLNIAVLMETGSTHPFAKAFTTARTQATEPGVQEKPAQDTPSVDVLASLQSLGYPVASIEHSIGSGVAALWQDPQGRPCGIYLGSARWCGLSATMQTQWNIKHPNPDTSASEVYMIKRVGSAQDESIDVLARFLFADELRPEAADLINSLRCRGLQLHLLSGDRQGPVDSVASKLQFHHSQANATPEDKQAYVAALQASGSVVLMVGDGVNDAPVLASADVSMASGDATSLARTAADTISLRPGLFGLDHLLNKAIRTRRIVVQNLFWAALYNLFAIPLAAFGMVPPWAAAVGMTASSLLVAVNAQRLWTDRQNPTINDTTTRRLWWNRFSY